MNLIIGDTFWWLIKLFVIIGELVYVIFAFVIVKQVKIMTETLELGFEMPIRYFSYVHLLFSAGILLLSFLIL